MLAVFTVLILAAMKLQFDKLIIFSRKLYTPKHPRIYAAYLRLWALVIAFCLALPFALYMVNDLDHDLTHWKSHANFGRLPIWIVCGFTWAVIMMGYCKKTLKENDLWSTDTLLNFTLLGTIVFWTGLDVLDPLFFFPMLKLYVEPWLLDFIVWTGWFNG